jgi:cellulose synthase/poly-beta-1,6-N-acetylglucosamine synthase-like glycosyltransferase
MKILFILSTTWTGISFIIAVINFLTMRVLRLETQPVERSVSVLVPMRNEEKNVKPLISALMHSQNLKNFQISVLDDESEDRTLQELTAFSDHITITRGTKVPPGWMGKPFACYQLSSQSTADYLLFIDADVRPTLGAISSAITYIEKLQWDFLSPYPAQKATTWLMRLIQPLLQWSWFASVPLRAAESGRVNSMIIANGQFFLVKRTAYESVNGHESVKAEVLEDLSLARTLSAAGFKGGVCDGSSLIRCSMYERNSDLINGYTKSLWKAFGGVSGTILTVAILVITQLLPAAMVISGAYGALLPLSLAALTHLLSSIKTRSLPINTIAHPIAIFLLILLICESYRRKILGRLEWRGRRVI